MFFHKYIRLFSHSLNFVFLYLLYRIGLIISFWFCFKNYRKIPRSNMFKLTKLIKAPRFFLSLIFFISRRSIFTSFFFRVFAYLLMVWPILFLTLSSTVVNCFTFCTSQHLCIRFLANMAAFFRKFCKFRHFCF